MKKKLFRNLISYYISFIFLIILAACKAKDESRFYIETSSGYGLVNNGSVIRKGVTIGFIEDVSIVGNKVIITFVLSSINTIPENSEIYVGAKDICTKALYIEYTNDSGKKSNKEIQLKENYRVVYQMVVGNVRSVLVF